MIKELNPPAEVKQLQAEARPLMTATVLAQQRLSKARQAVHDIEKKVAEVSAEATQAASELKSKLFQLEYKRQGLLADLSLGSDVQSELQTVDDEIAALRAAPTAKNLSDKRMGLLRRLAEANQELADASKAERKSRVALLTLLEEQAAAALEVLAPHYVKHLVTIQALAQLRGAQGVDGLIGNEVLMPKASLSRDASVVRLGAGEFGKQVSEETSRLTQQLEKRGVLVAPDALARLQSPSTKSYQVLDPLNADGKTYAPGDLIELPDVRTKQLLELGTIRAVERPADALAA